MSEQVNRKCPPGNTTVQLPTLTPTLNPQTAKPPKISNVVRRRMHTLRGVHYAHVTHMQITLRWHCFYVTFSQSKFPTRYDRLSEQQMGFLLFVILLISTVYKTMFKCLTLNKWIVVGYRNGQSYLTYNRPATENPFLKFFRACGIFDIGL